VGMADGDAGARSRPKTRIGAANIDRILDAALTAFARHGLRGTRIDQIADAAGMSKTNLLYYFRSKDDLYKAVLTRTLDIWLTPLRELDAARGPEASLTAYIEQKLDHSRRFPEASRLFAIEIMQGAPHLASVLETELAELVDRKAGILNGWIADGSLAPIDPRQLLFMVWATTQHYADFAPQIRALTGKGLEDEAFFAETTRSVVGVILRGVLGR
jgi:TetR/AcrR family transcriptional regulator